ncbi:MAG: phosphoglycerate kinase [Christensenellaceae bacterium]|jgi:3-phosphoglycerate kinase|nr:phosphoglycerate kinase [Christensenellaceae bacterium]
MNKKTILDVDVKGKKCLVRVDFNVPVSEDGTISDLNRIKGTIPTIEYLTSHGAKVILCSHLGRPKGEFNLKYSLRPVASALSSLLSKPVIFATDVIGDDAKAKVSQLKDGEILLLENLRFHKEEEKNDKAFCEALSNFCEVYVNDAFGTAHRAHASTAGIALYGFAPISVAGFLIGKELEIIGGALENPKRPFVAVLGGAKVSDKIGVINNLLEKVDVIIIGGAMAYTFNAAKGLLVGNSLCEKDKISLAQELIEKADKKGVKFLLPIDNVVADSFSNDANTQIVEGDILDGWQGLDIGPKTIKLFSKAVKNAKTVIWNGPMGVFEMEKFASGTKAIAKALSESDAVTIIGGGDSAAAVTLLGYADKMTHISTGGGASLEFLEGLPLPGVECLNDK